MKWNFQRSGRAWKGEEVKQRYDLTPGKMELLEGKLFWTEEERLNMLGLMLENVGIDKMLSLFHDLQALKEAIGEREEGNG